MGVFIQRFKAKKNKFSKRWLFSWVFLILGASGMLLAQSSVTYAQMVRVIGVVAGGDHTVVLKEDGTVWAWGRNNRGQLGNGTTNSSAVPVQVRDVGGFNYLNGIVALAAGESHTLALKNDGTVWAWGDNTYGQLGMGRAGVSDAYKTTPVKVKGADGIDYLTEVEEIAAGDYHSVARSRSQLWTWGRNDYGQLGLGTGNNGLDLTDRFTPVKPTGITSATAIAAGEAHTAALSGGRVYVWGRGEYGQLGNNTYTVKQAAPVPAVNRIQGEVRKISRTSITLDTSASSINDYYKGLRLSVTGAYPGEGIITRYTGSSRVASIAWNVTPAKFDSGAKYTYQIELLPGVKQIACGKNHTLALTTEGMAFGWGYNGFGQLGDKTTINQPIPTRITGNHLFSVLSGGGWHSLLLKNDGTILSCGRNDNGQLGNGVISTGTNPTPVQVKGTGKDAALTAITAVAAGGAHSLSIRPDGTLFAWGAYAYGQIGNDTSTDSSIPLLVDTTRLILDEPPLVIRTDPVNESTNVLPDTSISVTFSEAVVPGPYFGNITMHDVSNLGAPVARGIGTPTLIGSVLSFKPSGALGDGRKYQVYLPAGSVMDTNGNLLTDSYTFYFFTPDWTAPRVTSTYPVNDDTQVPITHVITLNFSEAMDPLTINRNTLFLEKLLPSGIYENVTGNVVYDAATQMASFIPSSNLDPNTDYRVTLSNLASDLAGNQLEVWNPLANLWESKPYIFSFTTGPDPSAPVVISHNPANNEQNVPLNKKYVTITYSKNLTMIPPRATIRYTSNTPPVFGYAQLVGRSRVELVFNENVENNLPNNNALKDAVKVAVDGLNFANLEAGDVVSLTANTLVIDFANPLSGNDTRIQVEANTLKNWVGVVLIDVVCTEALNASIVIPKPPCYRYATLDTTKKVVTLVYGVDLADNTGLSTPLAEAVAASSDAGATFTSVQSLGGTVAIQNGRKLVVTLTTPLSGNDNQLMVEAGVLKEAHSPGAVLPLVLTDLLDATLDPPVYRYADLDSTNSVVTITFSKDIFNHTGSVAALKQAITFAPEGSNYQALSAQDTVNVSGKTLVITFDNPLSGVHNRIKINAHTLRDRSYNLLATDVITDPIRVQVNPTFRRSIKDNELLFELTSPLLPDTTYTVFLPGGAGPDPSGGMMRDYLFRFTTVVDDEAPLVLFTDPTPGEGNVELNTPITIEFDEEVRPGGQWGAICLQVNTGSPATNPPVLIDTNLHGKILTVTPRVNLTINTPYILNLPAGAVQDLAGNDLAEPFILNFTTGHAVESVTLRVANGLYSNPGQTVEVPVTVRNAAGLTGAQFALVYERTKLDPLGLVQGIDLPAGWSLQYHVSPATRDLDKLEVTVMCTQGAALGQTEEGREAEILKLQLRVKENTPQGKTDLRFSDLSPTLTFERPGSIAVSTVDGQISVTNRILGDVNGDNRVDVDDVLLTIQYIMGQVTLDPLQIFAADLERDGLINVLDVVRIRNKALGQ